MKRLFFTVTALLFASNGHAQTHPAPGTPPYFNQCYRVQQNWTDTGSVLLTNISTVPLSGLVWWSNNLDGVDYTISTEQRTFSVSNSDIQQVWNDFERHHGAIQPGETVRLSITSNNAARVSVFLPEPLCAGFAFVIEYQPRKLTKTQAVCRAGQCSADTTQNVTVQPCDTLRYTMTATGGTKPLYNATIRDRLPDGVNLYAVRVESVTGTARLRVDGGRWTQVTNGATIAVNGQQIEAAGGTRENAPLSNYETLTLTLLGQVTGKNCTTP